MLDAFVASQSLKHVTTSFQELKRMKIANRKNMLCIDNEVGEWMTTKSLTKYFQNLLDQLEDDHE